MPPKLPLFVLAATAAAILGAAVFARKRGPEDVVLDRRAATAERLRALKGLPGERARALGARLALDPAEEVALRVAALGYLDVEDLRRLATDSEPEVREGARQALATSSPPEPSGR